MNNRLLAENEQKRLNIRLPMLFCFALFTAWQMGVVYFSGTAMSVDGRTPLPIDPGNLTPLIAIGYIASIIIMLFWQKHTVKIERVSAAVALVSALMLFLPLNPQILAYAYYLQCLCCCFMIGFETAVIVNYFSEKTALVHVTFVYGTIHLLCAVLQNEVVPMPFSVFRVAMALMIALQLFFYLKLPAKVFPQYAKKEDGLVCPKRLFAGLYLLVGLGCMLILFGISAAEQIKHGVSISYATFFVTGLVVFLLWKFCHISPLNVVPITIGVSVLGFAAATASLYIPQFGVPACVLLGVGFINCCMNPYYGVVMMKQYPTKTIAPGIIIIAFAAVMLHTGLIEIFRENIQILYIMYLVIAVATAGLFFIVQPYLLYSFSGKSSIVRELEARDALYGEDVDESPEELERMAREQEGQLDVLPSVAAAAVAVAEREKVEIVVTDATRSFSTHAYRGLTRKELQVMELMLRGASQSNIAEQMGTTDNTVSSQRKAILGKFGVESKAELTNLEREIRENGGRRKDVQ